MASLQDAVKSLADSLTYGYVHGTYREVSARYLITDARSRRKVWLELVSKGYIQNDTPGKVTEETKGEVTDKAFTELPAPAEPFVLADKYKYDSWQDRKTDGVAWVIWDNLDRVQKAAVIRAVQADPTAYTFYAYDRTSEKKHTTFALGTGQAAKDGLSRYDTVIAVSDAATQAKRDAAARAEYKEAVAKQGLTAFLQGAGVIEKEDTLPVANDTPAFGGGGPWLSNNPADWPKSLPAAIQGTKDKIKAARDRLALLGKMEAYVERVGGWAVFQADYESAVEHHVAEAFDGKK